jgi:hypothetical protein
MLEVITCTCGKNLGSLIDLYDFCWEKIKRDYRAKNTPDIATDRTQWDPKWNIESGPLMDMLFLELECCRVNMLAKTKISKLI